MKFNDTYGLMDMSKNPESLDSLTDLSCRNSIIFSLSSESLCTDYGLSSKSGGMLRNIRKQRTLTSYSYNIDIHKFIMTKKIKSLVEIVNDFYLKYIPNIERPDLKHIGRI